VAQHLVHHQVHENRPSLCFASMPLPENTIGSSHTQAAMVGDDIGKLMQLSGVRVVQM